MVNEPTTPISDLTPFVRHLDHCVVWKPGALRCNCGLADAFDAALASPEGVVTLTDEERALVESYRAHWPFDGDHPLVSLLDRLAPYQPEDTNG